MTSMIQSVFILLLPLLLSSCAVFSNRQPADNPFHSLQLVSALQDALEEATRVSNAAGASASLYVSDKCYWEGVTGSTELGNPIEEKMLFGFASITKTFVAAIILQLVEEEKLGLDDRLGKWLPEYPNIDSDISVRQLLNHGSGFYNYTDSGFWSEVESNPDRVWIPEELLGYVEPPPRIGFSMPRYSNTNYILLGMIIESVTGNSFEQELENRIIGSINLNSTYLASHDFVPEQWASSKALLNSMYSGVWAAGAIASTSKDIAKWSHTLYSGRYLRSKSLELMFKTEPRRGPGGGGGAVGLGVWKQRVGEFVVWGHDGWLFPFVSSTYFVPDLGISVAYSSIEPDESQPDFLYQSLVRTYVDNQPKDISMCFDS